MGHQNGELGGVRTRDHLIKSQMLYQLSYQPTQPDGLNQVAGLSYVGASVCQTFFDGYLQCVITARNCGLFVSDFVVISCEPLLQMLGRLEGLTSLQLSHVPALMRSKKLIRQYRLRSVDEILCRHFLPALCRHKNELH